LSAGNEEFQIGQNAVVASLDDIDKLGMYCTSSYP